MSLKGTRILVDGYNLQMTQGTGIKTYGISLVQALKSLGSDVSVLFGRNLPFTNDEMLDEILFFDVGEGRHKYLDSSALKRFLGFGSDAFRAAVSISQSAQAIQKGGVVVRSPMSGSVMGSVFNILDLAEFYNLSGCYQTANALFKVLGLSTKVGVPQKVDIFHATYTIPIQVKGAKKVTTIHDLIPLKLPFTTLDNKRFFYKIVQQSLKDSAAIATVSESSKKDILQLFNIDPVKVHVTYQPIALKPLETDEEKLARYLKRFRIKPKNYILFVGAIEPKKNVGRLIDAYARLDTDTQLVIVGKRGWLWENEIGRIDSIFGQKVAAKKVQLLDYVTSEDLRHLYTGATALCFPSLYEGFGLPPLEAMSFGCPVITSNVSSLPEICGDAALYVNPYDVSAIEEQLERLIGDEALQAELVAKGYERAKFFSPENYHQRLASLYSSIL
jgi:glycosyltransferase involved in cell wall biosynthesis